MVCTAWTLSAGHAGFDHAAELESPGSGRARGKADRRLGRRLVRGGLLRRPRPGPHRQSQRRGQALLRLRVRSRPAHDWKHPYRHRRADCAASAETSLCRQGLSRRPDGDSRGNPGARSRSAAGNDFQPLLLLLARVDARPGVRRNRRRRTGWQLDRAARQLRKRINSTRRFQGPRLTRLPPAMDTRKRCDIIEPIQANAVPVAQLDRASASEAEGYRFDSCRGYYEPRAMPFQKRADYAEARVQEYWIVNPQTESITVLRLEGTAYAEAGQFRRGESATSILLEGFAVE